MTQHDFDIANAPGATVRGDLNNLFEAIATQNSGSSAPSVTFANMPWFDTATNILYNRNASNTAWVAVAEKNGANWKPYYLGTLLGDASTKTAGSAIGNLPLLEDVGGSAGLPAVDGSQLTGIGTAASGWDFVVSKTGGSANIDFVGGTDYTTADWGALLFLIDAWPVADENFRMEVKLSISGWTVTDAAASPFRSSALRMANAVDDNVATRGFVGLSVDRSVDNVEASAWEGVVEVLGLRNQSVIGAKVRFDGVYRDSTGAQSGGIGIASVRKSITTEQVVGFRFYYNTGSNFHASSRITAFGMPFDPS